MHFGEVVLERDAALRANRVRKRCRVDIRIAVAIAADPRAHLQERRHARGFDAEFPQDQDLERTVEPRDLVQKRVPVVREAVVDLVFHLQPRHAKHRRLPQLEHRRVQAECEFIRLVGRQRRPVPPRQQPRDLPLYVENALALDLGRVCRQHGAYSRVVEPVLRLGAIHTALRETA
jgi:hypothetical protein